MNAAQTDDKTQALIWRSSLTELAGVEIDEFRLERIIGQGGASVVYLATDTTLDRKVAFKLLRPGGLDNTDTERRFQREARAVAKLDHPNIVQVHRVGQYDGMYYIVMQHIDGETLNEYMGNNPDRGVAESLQITRQIAEALQVAHEHGLTHRDIKPSNIMIDESGRVKVMDFGLVRHSDGESQLTKPGMYIGTPMYSSPEQCETKTVDQRSDLYSLGVILYELLSGQVPHKADTPLALMRKIVYEAPADMRSINEELPKPAIALVDQLLAKKPDDRTESAEKLIGAIDAINCGGPLPVSGEKKYQRPILLLAAVCCIVAVLFINWPHDLNSVPPQNPGPGMVEKPVEKPLTFAMYDFQNLTKDAELQWMEIGISDLVTANLSQYPGIKVLSRDEILWSESDQAEQPTQVDGRLNSRLKGLGVGIVAKGQIVRVKGQVRVITFLYRLGEAKMLKSFTHNGDVSDLFSIVDRLSADITVYLDSQRHLFRAAVRAERS